MIQIKHRITGEVICEGQTMLAAVGHTKNLQYADLQFFALRGCNLQGCNLQGSDLQGCNLRFSDLRGSDLQGCNLRGCNLQGSDLQGCNLRGCNLRFSDLQGCNLRGCNLRGSDLQGCNLRGITLTWQSHDLLAEILRRAAGDDMEKLKVAGLILVSRSKCWLDFLSMAAHEPLADWAFDELARWVKPGDGAPDEIMQRAAANEAAMGKAGK